MKFYTDVKKNFRDILDITYGPIREKVLMAAIEVCKCFKRYRHIQNSSYLLN